MSKTAFVGMDLDTSGGNVVQAIIEAIEQDNEGVIVEDYQVYIKVKSPEKMVLRRETVEEMLGRDWEMDHLHIYMSSYFGFIEDWDENHLIIEWKIDE